MSGRFRRALLNARSSRISFIRLEPTCDSLVQDIVIRIAITGVGLDETTVNDRRFEMKKTAMAITLMSALLVVGVSNASPQTRSEGDMLYGNGAVNPSASQPYEVTGPVQHRSENYLLWNVSAYTPVPSEPAGDRVADDRRMSTDLIYGS